MKSNHNFTLGISSDERIVLDLDDTDFKTVDYWADRTLKWFDLGGYLILKSSPGCYHIVFNRTVNWSENMRVVAWVAFLSGNEGARGDQNGQIQEFIELRNEVKNILKNL